MFDPSLTFENGLDRVGEVLDFRWVEIEPDDHIFERTRQVSAAWQALFDENALAGNGSAGIFGGYHLGSGNDRHKQLWTLIDVPVSVDQEVLVRAGEQRYMSADIYACEVIREAILNALEHGRGGKISLLHLVGRDGEFVVVGQEKAGPALEETFQKHVDGKLANYFVGNQMRGCGLRSFAMSRVAQVWHADLQPGYALLIFAPSNGRVVDLKEEIPVFPPHPANWRPEPDSLGERLWHALVNCKAELADPRIYYADFFLEQGLSLDEALQRVEPQVRKLFELNVSGFLGEID